MGSERLTSGSWRLLRAGTLMLLIMCSSVLVHQVAHGTVPGIFALVTLAAVVLALATLVSLSRFTLGPLLAIFSASQVLLHFGFSLLSAHPSHTVSHLAGLSGHQHGAVLGPMPLPTPSLTSLPTNLSPSQVLASDPGSDLLMFTVHAALTVGLSVGVRWWDALLHQLLDWLRQPLILLFPASPYWARLRSLPAVTRFAGLKPSFWVARGLTRAPPALIRVSVN